MFDHLELLVFCFVMYSPDELAATENWISSYIYMYMLFFSFLPYARIRQTNGKWCRWTYQTHTHTHTSILLEIYVLTSNFPKKIKLDTLTSNAKILTHPLHSQISFFFSFFLDQYLPLNSSKILCSYIAATNFGSIYIMARTVRAWTDGHTHTQWQDWFYYLDHQCKGGK